MIDRLVIIGLWVLGPAYGPGSVNRNGPVIRSRLECYIIISTASNCFASGGMIVLIPDRSTDTSIELCCFTSSAVTITDYGDSDSGTDMYCTSVRIAPDCFTSSAMYRYRLTRLWCYCRNCFELLHLKWHLRCRRRGPLTNLRLRRTIQKTSSLMSADEPRKEVLDQADVLAGWPLENEQWRPYRGGAEIAQCSHPDRRQQVKPVIDAMNVVVCSHCPVRSYRC